MSRRQKDSTIPSVASTSREGQENRTLKVTLLSSEWKSSTDGGLSTINRELAIQLAKHSNVDVSVLLPECSEEDRSSAESRNVKLIEAGRVPGLEPVLCLSSPPRNHIMDCVIGHGVNLGQPIALIKRNPNYHHCKWIQVVHSAPEEDGMYKNILEGQKKQETEIQLCKMADQVITIGPKLAEVYKRYLCHSKRQQDVFDLTPSIFSEFLEVEQATEERRTFCVLVIGSGDSCEDFNVKGYDIAAKAIAELKDELYKLRFICPPGGKGDEMAVKLLRHGISRNQLIVRNFNDSREVLANLFCEVDLAIMPSRTEGFGITALEALSAGLPILVCGNSGLGEALKEVPLGSYCVVDSEDPKDWAKEIKNVCQKKREVRLTESRFLRANYLEKYSWEEPSRSLVEMMYKVTFADQHPKGLREESSGIAHHEGGTEQVICSLQQWQQNANRYRISSSTDPLTDLHEIASKRGYRISNNPGSGNCMFFALSEQLEIVKKVKIHHFELRYSLVQYLREHPELVDGTDLFHFVERHTTWGGYLTDMEQDGTWGDHLILWAAANCYRLPICVISSLPNNSEVIINPDSPLDKNKHLVLGHVHEVHYVSLQPLQGFNSYGLPAPSTVDYRNPPATFVNPNYQESQTFPQGSILHDQLLSSVNQSQPSSQASIWTHQDPSCHSNHTQDSFGHGVSPPFVLQNQFLSPAPIPVQPGLTNHKGNSPTVICRLLKKEYNRRSQLKPLFWDNTIQLPLKDVFTRLKILRRRKRDFRLENNEVNMNEIFKSGDDITVLVEGSPGIGKTTFCLKIAHDWANKTISKVDSFPEFEVVLLLKCRDIHGDIIEAIDEQLLPKCNSEAIKKELIDYIEDFHYQKKVLIILDGLDELPKMSEIQVDRLLKKKMFPFCYVLATSRQERGIVVRQKVDFDLLLQIEGFTWEDALEYIRRHFKNAGPGSLLTGERLITEIQKSTFLDALWNNPLNLLLLCIVFEDYQGELPSYRTELYQIIVCCILRRYCAKHDLEAPVDDKALVRLFEDSLLVLGELAWRCLKEDRFSFREEELAEFESTNAYLAARELGLVFKEASLRKINPQHEYFFFHKTFQEYLAAYYLANGLLKKEVDSSESHFCFDRDMLQRYRQVFIFMSGILGENAGFLFEHIGKKLKEKNWDWYTCTEGYATCFDKCFNESRNDEQVAMALCSCIPFPQTATIDLSSDDRFFLIVLKYFWRFSQLQLPVQVALKYPYPGDYLEEDVDALAAMLASNTQLQTLSISSNVSREITTLMFKALTVDSTLRFLTLETVVGISSSEVIAMSDSFAANKTLTTVTLKMPYEILRSWIAILDKGLSADTPLTSVVLEIFGSWWETEDLKKILLNRSLTSLTLTLFGDMEDSLTTSISEGLVANPSLKSLALTVCGKLSYSGLALLKNGILGNRSLEYLELKVFGELPTNWVNISRTLLSAIKSTTSFTVYPNVTGMVGTSQVAYTFPVLEENLLASKLHSLSVNFLGELNYSGANDLCKQVRASSVSCVTLNFKERVTDSVANCLFKHLNKLNTLSELSISIQGELTGKGKNTLERLSRNQTYLFALNVPDSNSGDKICREVGLFTDDSLSLTPVFTKVKDDCITKLSVSVNNPDSISGDWGCTLQEGLAKSEFLTTLSLIFSDTVSTEKIDAPWDTMAENTSLTTLNLTFNDYGNKYDMSCDLSDGLAEKTSLTILSLTLNSRPSWERGTTIDIIDDLAKNTSLTMLSLTRNYYHCVEVWNCGATFDVSDGLARNTSLTTLSLTIGNYGGEFLELSDETFGVSDGLARNTSLTTLSLTLNIYHGGYSSYHDKKFDVRDGLARNTSLTTLSLTINNYSKKCRGIIISNLSDGLAENTSLTMLNFTINNYKDLHGDVTRGLSCGLAKNTSLTRLSLTVNNYGNMSEDCLTGLSDGLANNKFLTTLCLTMNNCVPSNSFYGLKNALAKNTSLITLKFTLSNCNNLYGNWIRELADALARNTSLSTVNLELNIFSEENLNSESSSV